MKRGKTFIAWSGGALVLALTIISAIADIAGARDALLSGWRWAGVHGRLGWSLLIVSLLFVGGGVKRMASQHAAEVESLSARHQADMRRVRSDAEEREREILAQKAEDVHLQQRRHAADVQIVEQRLGEFGKNGRLRQMLADFPHDKYFSTSLARPLDLLCERLNEPEEIYDGKLREQMAELVAMIDAYWGSLSVQLDSRPGCEGTFLDLQLPPAESRYWAGDHEARNVAFYGRVRELERQRIAVVKQFQAIDARVHHLRVESGVQ